MSADDALPGLEAELTALRRRGRASVREASRALDPRLDPTVYPMLVVLHHAGELRMSDLGAVLAVDKSTLSRQVDAAARLGLLDRAVDPRDARARLVALTPAGRDRLAAVLDGQRARLRASLAGWSGAEVTALTGLLRKLGESGIA